MSKDKVLFEARDEFRDLLAKAGTPEADFQRLFSRHPFLLSDTLPLRLSPADIRPLGRPGKAEVDFLIYPQNARLTYVYGAVEIKRPDTQILRTPRKQIVTLSTDAATALAQGKHYAAELGRELQSKLPPFLAVGNSEYVFLILGMRSELEHKLKTQDLRRQFSQMIPPNCTILTYDTLLETFEQKLPPLTQILIPAGNLIVPNSSDDSEFEDNPIFWHLCARHCARHAHEVNFSSRRGVYEFVIDEDTEESAICLYNNNPYAKSAHFREDETARFRAWMQAQQIRELSYAIYPEKGEGAGYSYAMLIGLAGSDNNNMELISDAIRKETNETLRRLHE